jgi:hypothetical protein
MEGCLGEWAAVREAVERVAVEVGAEEASRTRIY